MQPSQKQTHTRCERETLSQVEREKGRDSTYQGADTVLPGRRPERAGQRLKPAQEAEHVEVLVFLREYLEILSDSTKSKTSKYTIAGD